MWSLQIVRNGRWFGDALFRPQLSLYGVLEVVVSMLNDQIMFPSDWGDDVGEYTLVEVD
jgi:hypothetical protein